MGYTTQAGLELLGFGPSAISELPRDYAQSERELEAWNAAVRAGRLATLRGHRLSDDDVTRRAAIARVMCHGEVAPGDVGLADPARLAALEADGLVERAPGGGLRVTPLGRILVRNVAMAFDAWLPAQAAEARPRFSQTV
jgi:oxygen-independent coproporphyrinogen-3 oxidase